MDIYSVINKINKDLTEMNKRDEDTDMHATNT